jgi:peptidyl-Lys metalloendopeptidase
MSKLSRLLPAIAGATVLAGAIAAANAAPDRSAVSPLRVGLFPAGAGMVEVEVTNTANRTARILRWQLPQDVLRADLFTVSRDGKLVDYEGALVKRGAPDAADFMILRPGQTWRSVVDLAATYDMSRSGEYTIALASPLQHASLSGGQRLIGAKGSPLVLSSPALRLWHDGGAAPYAAALDPQAAFNFPCNPRKPQCRGGGGGGAAVRFVGCSATQVTEATNAVVAARTYSENAKGYLGAGTTGPRYTTWFGGYTGTRYATAQANFVAIDTAMDQNAGQIAINCGCDEDYFAYVYPNRPYEIFVCRSFWSAPMTGTDSKAGTLVHEMSHFNVVAGTRDHAYGQAAARNLAIAEPDRALANADSHEYFSENTPFQN